MKRRLWAASVFAVLLLAGALGAADPSLSGESLVPEYRIVRLKINDLGPKDAVRWKVRADDPKADKNAIDYGNGGRLDQPSLDWVAPPGKYTIEALVVKPTPDGSFTLVTLEKSVEIFRRGPVGPNPPVTPIDPVNPPGPAPAPDVDAALAAKYKTAIAADIAAKFPGGGSKESAKALASVYVTASELMSGDDETQWPKTIGEMYERFASAAAAKMIPRPPYLSAVRDVSGAYLGNYPSDKTIDKALRLELASKFRVAGLALAKGAE